MEISLALLAFFATALLIRFRNENKKLSNQVEALKTVNRQLREIRNNK